ncbi:ferredoxin [Paenibacillus selenitireducens]|uniref:Ferredoxin n=1 Tax=Paenibacillus selenitireducens TaxID=1324314 RepID=A0A1T2XNH3_9BACL|nr:2Fe-2S iron-sulfur cluster-binding protein [Paenibacillus selenitireducens]OPA81429.1 ferredoxin [Paenibacillus selenitireducens]
MGQSIQLKGRTIAKEVEIELGKSILDMAVKHGVDWGFSCTRGTCARCRCFIESGAEFLEAPTDAEYNRLDEEEIEAGYRLGCQAIVKVEGSVVAINKTYF